MEREQNSGLVTFDFQEILKNILLGNICYFRSRDLSFLKATMALYSVLTTAR